MDGVPIGLRGKPSAYVSALKLRSCGKTFSLGWTWGVIIAALFGATALGRMGKICLKA